MPRLRRETLQGMAWELLGIDLSFADMEKVLAQVGAWQERFARLSELNLDNVEPACLPNPGEE